MGTTITTSNLYQVLRAIQSEECSVLRTDRGNGCAGPALIGPDAVTYIRVDEVVAIDEIPSDVRDEFVAELDAMGSRIDAYTHVGIEREEDTGWTGFYLLWMP